MWILSGTLALTDGSILYGAAIKDGGEPVVSASGFNVRYLGSQIHPANAGLSDLVQCQDFVTRLHHDSAAFYNLMSAFVTNGLASSVTAQSSAADVADSVFQFSAVLTDGSYVYVAGSSADESPTIRTNDLTNAMTILAADTDFVGSGILSGVIS